MMMKPYCLFFLPLIFALMLCSKMLQAQDSDSKTQDSETVEKPFTKSQYFMGLNIGKSVFHFAQSHDSYSIDPELRMRVSKKATINVGLGYNRYGAQKDSINLPKYQSEGFYIKVGGDFFNRYSDTEMSFLIGFDVFYANFLDRGTFVIKEKFFGDYIENFERRNLQTGGANFNLGSWIPLGRRFVLVVGGRLTLYREIIMSNLQHSQLPIYYFPNAGINLFPRNLQGGGVGIGFDFKVLYRII